MEKFRYKAFILLLHAGFLSGLFACTDRNAVPGSASILAKERSSKTENVVVVVIDGPRFSDTWGKEGQPHIPKMARYLTEEGTFFSNFQNEGPTYTLAGHTAITTGNYQHIANDGSEIPLRPSIFQHYLQQTNQAPEKACFVTSKSKLNVLADARDMDWRGRYNPLINCGEAGENRKDSLTYLEAINTLSQKQPKLMLVQFLGPDANGHADNWQGYLRSLEETDSLVHALWQYIQQDEHYQNKTALLITNDHGRHADGDGDGFVSHGDGCESCRHISLLALGPDFPQSLTVEEEYTQVDLAPTIARLLNFQLAESEGSPIPFLVQ